MPRAHEVEERPGAEERNPHGPMSGTGRFDWLNIPVEDAARRLLGCELVGTIGGTLVRARIVETEAYDEADPASHTFRGLTPRTAPMFDSAGHLYVYLIHGIHHCCNIVTGRAGYGSGALIRALEPLTGEDEIQRRRGSQSGVALTNGPGKLCQALGITRALSGHDLSEPPLQLIRTPPVADDRIVTSRRIGISRAVDALRRYSLRGSSYVSRG